MFENYQILFTHTFLCLIKSKKIGEKYKYVRFRSNEDLILCMGV